MRTNILVRSAALPVLLFSSGATRTQSGNRRDGNWWIDLKPDYKLSYVVGFYDGMELGNEFSIWEMSEAKDTKSQNAVQRAVSSYTHFQEQYMSQVTN